MFRHKDNTPPDPETGTPIPVTETPDPGTEGAKKKKKGYVRYSPLMLVILAILCFIFCFSLVMFLDTRLIETASGIERESVISVAFDAPDPPDEPVVYAPAEGEGALAPTEKETGTWQVISPSAISPSSLPYLKAVNFNALSAKNPDTVAWMYWPTSTYVKGLPINTPIVQHVDNQFYLDYSYDGTASENGAVFVDSRCDMRSITSNYNTVFYGHARSYLMFGGLKYLNAKTKWGQDGYNHFIYINTPYERTVWQVFSWYETTVAFNYIRVEFDSDGDYAGFLNTVQSKNQIPALEHISLAPTDRIITLSTCKGTDENVRVAVHAVLVKSEKLNERGEPISTDTATDSSGTASGTTVTDRPTDSSGTSSGTVTQTTDTNTKTDPKPTTGTTTDTATNPSTGTSTGQTTNTSSSTDTSTSTGTVTDTATGSTTGTSTASTTDTDTQSGSGGSGGTTTDKTTDTGTKPE